MKFAASPRSSLGVEWELAVVDPATGQIVPRAKELLAEVDDPRFDKEFLTGMIELITGVHTTTDEAVDELRRMRDKACAVADRQGVALVGTGTHPTSRWREQSQGDDPRYARVIEKAGDWGRRLIIFGVHNHVGIEDRDKVVPLMRTMLDRLPLILALSASSPYWQGIDTGFASHRTMLFQQLPTGGLPPMLVDWGEYERTLGDMLTAGVIEDVGELRWDVRPSPAIGTVEVRVADGAPSVDDLAGVTALVHCLIEEASRALDEGEPQRHLPSWLVRENKWRAARDGLDATAIVDEQGTLQPVRAAIAEAIERLAPVAGDLGATRSLAAAARVLERGGSAAQQRAAYARGGHDAVLAEVLEAMRA
ncbi:glutamate--cysteine ligase 2 [Agrococcus baldri]|uniref:Putative glutamate--cysteine ligase 2 n=1 Tax=Agrococcus baldri TaxID=153730 RepID=A0AA87R8U9_9MICO|nr:glutamate--cysteine ligase [Agrococcus baldri]GEK78769.1 putative glutamate--cysteine ligase 2 [Agrococcus baldri]